MALEAEHSLTAMVTGLIAGFVVSIPVGPINLTIINEGARRGFKWAIMIGMGSVLMESIYCALALTGFSAFLAIPVVKAVMELVSFLFLLFLSWRFFSARSIPTHTHGADVIEQKLHPRSAFMVGFVRVLGNPSVLLLWATLTATFLSHNWVDETWGDRVGCVIGVAMGAALWFLLLSWAVSKGHGKMSPRVLLRIEHFSGAIMLLAALWFGGRIVLQLHEQHKQNKQRRQSIEAVSAGSQACCIAGHPSPLRVAVNYASEPPQARHAVNTEPWPTA
jgi:threonine/homoserine/homoserine lactone efflux protein